MIITPDSATLLGVGSILGKSGQIPPTGLSDDMFLGLMKNRIGLLSLILAGGYIFGVKFYNFIFPLSAFYFLPTFALLFFYASEGLNVNKVVRLLLGGCGTLMILSVPAYWYHAYYVHQNLLTSIFYSIAIFSVFIYRDKRDREWLIIGAITLGITPLLRNEMLAFSAIVVAMLMSTPDLERKDYAMFLFVFFCTFLPMQLLRSYYLGLGRAGVHEWGGIQLAVAFGYLISYFIVHFDITKSKIASAIPNILISALIIFIIIGLYLFHGGVITSIYDLLQIISVSKGAHNWGVIWLAIAVIIINNISFMHRKDFNFWIQILIFFFSMRILVYSLGFQLNQFSSGSRILLHIMPTGVFYIFFLLASLLSDTFAKNSSALKCQAPRASQS